MISGSIRWVTTAQDRMATRRLILTASAFAFWPLGMDRAAAAPVLEGSASSRWMDAAIATSAERGDVNGVLHLGRFRDPYYYLLRPIAWEPTALDDGDLKRVSVPVGFVTDLASIPPLFWTALRPDGEYAHAAIIHDYLYWTQTTTRENADRIFRSAMESLRIDPATITAIYAAVRVGGGAGWKVEADRKARGERRILRLLPDDPRVTWREWSRRKDVF